MLLNNSGRNFYPGLWNSGFPYSHWFLIWKYFRIFHLFKCFLTESFILTVISTYKPACKLVYMSCESWWHDCKISRKWLLTVFHFHFKCSCAPNILSAVLLILFHRNMKIWNTRIQSTLLNNSLRWINTFR